nr:MAG TPA: Protein of unknown function (DUF983) [Caudoviricetes sp.]
MKTSCNRVVIDLIFSRFSSTLRKIRKACNRCGYRLSWSEWRDLNSRPLDPQSVKKCVFSTDLRF